MKESGRKKSTPAENHSAPPTQEEIAQRAYEIFLARGGEPGRDEDDWRQAERELLEGRAKARGRKA